MRDARAKWILLVTSPLWVTTSLIGAAIMLLAMAIAYIPVIGIYLALPLFFLASPSFGIWQWVSFTFISFSREQIVVGERGFVVRSAKNEVEVPWAALVKAIRVFEPPLMHFNLVLANGEEIQLNPFADVEKLLSELKERNIAVEWEDA